MYKVKKITDGVLHSNGYVFNTGIEVEVDEKTFNYLKKTFKDLFEFIEEKPVKKPETKIVEKKEEVKPKRGRAKKDS